MATPATPKAALLQPQTPEALAAALRAASAQKQSIVIRGAGTKMDWGRPAGRIDAFLETRGLHKILAHAHGDLTATIEAGASLADVNAALATHGQWLPLDPAFADRATIGGLLATNDSGPLRHRYGTPRDLVIGVQIATADGTLAKAGGQVVKNVAGYDLGKLVTGSFGSLAAITSATFKLSPLPKASKTLVVSVDSDARLGEIVRQMMASQLEPLAFEFSSGTVARSFQGRDRGGPERAALLIKFASLPTVVDAQVAQARALLQPLAASIDVVDGDAEPALWREHNARMWAAPCALSAPVENVAIVRASWLPSAVTTALAELVTMGAPIDLVGRAAVGAGLLRIGGDTATQARVIARLRQSASVGNIVVLRGSDALKAAVDVWGPMGDRERLLASLKHALDPRNTLNAGRGPL
ncbi:MAG: FAD-binding oxidoreductase [Acidobacteria bacterium]|nr:FAD-binding oxidoreductase [Acidobacteriota bacterium]